MYIYIYMCVLFTKVTTTPTAPRSLRARATGPCRS